ncbi:hypothetical protein CVT26_012062 [Gymnopilus dilepis]|uniref:Uncharacterized protein n=1 Tax=Gymnopilus dilepis TaxID=231916 RepID=A0A409W993_9AGAR|nr:hypothetical protein CVT26_012062 [Gymnopilus dilepis]
MDTVINDLSPHPPIRPNSTVCIMIDKGTVAVPACLEHQASKQGPLPSLVAPSPIPHQPSSALHEAHVHVQRWLIAD